MKAQYFVIKSNLHGGKTLLQEVYVLGTTDPTAKMKFKKQRSKNFENKQ